MKIVITGAAGFIGAACSKKLLERSDQIIGIDNLNDYYDISLKEARLKLLQSNKNFKFYKADIKEFCKKMGWNPENGYPLKETLADLNLDFVIKDLY